MKNYTQLSLRFKCCSDLLADADDWTTFELAVEATRSELEKLKPLPYKGSSIPFPPAHLFSLIDRVDKLALCDGSVGIAEVCNELDEYVSDLDAAHYEALALEKFKTSLMDLILAIKVKSVNPDPENIKLASEAVEKAQDALLVSYELLPDKLFKQFMGRK